MIKKFWVYKSSLIKRGDWIFDDEYDTEEEALAVVEAGASSRSWRAFKIEIVYMQPEPAKS